MARSVSSKARGGGAAGRRHAAGARARLRVQAKRVVEERREALLFAVGAGAAQPLAVDPKTVALCADLRGYSVLVDDGAISPDRDKAERQSIEDRIDGFVRQAGRDELFVKLEGALYVRREHLQEPKLLLGRRSGFGGPNDAEKAETPIVENADAESLEQILRPQPIAVELGLRQFVFGIQLFRSMEDAARLQELLFAPRD